MAGVLYLFLPIDTGIAKALVLFVSVLSLGFREWIKSVTVKETIVNTSLEDEVAKLRSKVNALEIKSGLNRQ